MPPLQPVAGRAPLYARDSGTGLVYLVGGSGDELEVEVSPTDPITSNPSAELWYRPAAAPPPVPPTVWDPVVTYAAGDYCLWPTIEEWQTSTATTGDEPGVPIQGAAEGYTFPGDTGSPEGLSASVSINNFGGYEARVKRSGALADGSLVNGNDASAMFCFAVGGGNVTVGARQTDSFGGIRMYQTPISALDPSKMWLKATVTGGGWSLSESDDGVAWTQVAGGALSAGLLMGNTTSLSIGSEGQIGGNYGGTLCSVEVTDGGGVLAAAWNALTIPSDDGTGTDPVTGVTWSQVGPTALVPFSPTTIPSPWVPAVVPTATVPGVLHARVNGVWEVVSSGDGTDEVWVGPDDPYLIDPASEQELWYDNALGVDVLRVRTSGAWVDVSTGSEVHVGPDDPDLTNPKLSDELWYDTDEVPPPGLSLSIDYWDAAVAYSTGDQVIWTQADPNIYSALRDTVAGEEPGVVTDAWEWIAELNGPYLPLAGGMMSSGAVIQFPNAVGRKINLYADTFGLGVSGGSTEVFASSAVRFRQNNPDTGDQWAYIDANCGGGRVLTEANGQPRDFAQFDNLALTAGTVYRVAAPGFGANSANGVAYEVSASLTNQSASHTVQGVIDLKVVASTISAVNVVFANCKQGGIFNACGTNSQAEFVIRSAVTGNVNVGIRAWNIQNGVSSVSNFGATSSLFNTGQVAL